MERQLIAVSGPLRGLSFRLEKAETTLGREPQCDIHVMESSVSRRHCAIYQDGDRLWVRDLGSLNGTLMNGVPVTEHPLKNGDQLKIGQSEFVFQQTDGGDREGSEVEFRENECETRTVILRGLLEEQPLLASLRSLQLEEQKHDAKHLETLLGIATEVCSVRNLRKLRKAEAGTLERELLARIAAAIPSAESAILHMEVHDEAPQAAFVWPQSPAANRGAVRGGAAERNAPLSPRETAGMSSSAAANRGAVRGGAAERNAPLSPREVAVASCSEMRGSQFSANLTLVREALRTGATMLSAFNGPGDKLTRSGNAGTLVTPLFVNRRPSGVIYLVAENPASGFTDAQAKLLAAIAEVASLAFENLQHWQWLEGENQRLLEELKLSRPILGDGSQMRELYQFVSKVAPAESTVLIRGESGTGKELMAHAIHETSPRAQGPFVAINCAAITETLLESELFGHERGAFTGAVALKKGKLEVADGGTLFLDEVGELPLPMQVKLLRVLQEREFERVGGTRPIRVSVRILAATNRDLEQEVREGRFRQDLYYRLNVVSVSMPPLRERKEDIPLLARYFAVKHAARCNRKVQGISPEARELLLRYDWPGNVRELENAIERAVVLGSGDTILAEDLPETLLEQRGPAFEESGGYHETLAATKRRVILEAFRKAGGNYTETARLLGVHPNYLHRLIRNLDLKADMRRA